MSITNLNPYLNFNGDAEKAIKLYEKALGAKAENVMRWSEMPPGEGDVKPEVVTDAIARYDIDPDAVNPYLV